MTTGIVCCLHIDLKRPKLLTPIVACFSTRRPSSVVNLPSHTQVRTCCSRVGKTQKTAGW
jgi:hypothetical protein